MIRLTLICGSLEPHKDGVGDYCQTLAAALRQRGAHVTLIGLNDKYMAGEAYADSDTLRLPAAWPARRRYARAAEAIEQWSPDWISLQFVNWNFGWKGIVTSQTKWLRQLTHGRHLHIMFHETWVGGAPEIIPHRLAKLRRKILGQLQKASFRTMTRALPYALAHVSNAGYQKHLACIDVKALQLPMFGSVEVAPRETWPQVRARLTSATGFEFPASRSEILLIGMFGAVRACPVEPALEAIMNAVRHIRRVILVSFGAIGPFGEDHLAAWRRQIPDMTIVATGPLGSASLSSCFQELDAAISLHPAGTIGRSSAAAALLEHGVPVICPWGELPPRDDAFAARWANLLISSDRIHEVMFDPPTRICSNAGAGLAAEQLMADIKKSRSKGENSG